MWNDDPDVDEQPPTKPELIRAGIGILLLVIVIVIVAVALDLQASELFGAARSATGAP